MSLEGRRVAILIEDLYEDLEAWYPFLRLKEAGAQVLFVGREKGLTHGSKRGYPAVADLGFRDARPEDFDAIVVAGGFAPDYMRRSPESVRLVKDAFERGALVAAICHGAWLPASAGVLRGRRATCYPSIKDDVVNAGARYEDREVVVDGRLITSRRPSDLPAFCRAIVEALAAQPVQR